MPRDHDGEDGQRGEVLAHDGREIAQGVGEEKLEGALLLFLGEEPHRQKREHEEKHDAHVAHERPHDSLDQVEVIGEIRFAPRLIGEVVVVPEDAEEEVPREREKDSRS